VYFKRRVYQQALEELAPFLYPEGAPIRRMQPSAQGAVLGQKPR
jgi:putative (di)nucleoside polyphosphate hydrolase